MSRHVGSNPTLSAIHRSENALSGAEPGGAFLRICFRSLAFRKQRLQKSRLSPHIRLTKKGARRPQRSQLMAALTFFPSIGIGILWSRHRSLWLCFAVHAWYNMLFWN